jgi:hypothetical protein
MENMRKAWDPQQPVESLFKKIKDCVYYAEAGGITTSEAQKLQTLYAFKTHFAMAYLQHKQIQG